MTRQVWSGRPMAIEVTVAKRTRGGRPLSSPRAAQVVFVVLLLILWQIGAAVGQLGAVPTPLEVSSAVLGELVDGTVWAPLGETLSSWAISLALAIAVGIVVGFPLGASRVAYRMSVVAIDFLRTIPALVFVPLVVLLYGSGIHSVVLLAFFSGVWAVMMQAIYGGRDVDPVARDTFRSFRVRGTDVITRLLVPTALPYIATGVRLAAAVCLLVTISAQIVIPAGGFGEQILTNQLGGAIPQMYAYIVLCGVLGVLVDAVFRRLEKSVLAWHPSHRRASA